MKKLLKRKNSIRITALMICMISLFFAFPNPKAYTAADKIIDIALNEEGYTAENGYNKFGGEFGNGYTAWCNYFVVWCAKKAGISPEVITGGKTYDGNCFSYMCQLNNKGYFHVNDKSYTPRKGDLVFYNSTKSLSGATHIGLVVSAKGDMVETVEGNVTVKGKRGVGVNLRPRYSYVGSMIIIGFASPLYGDEKVEKVKLIPNNYNSVKKSAEKKNIIDVNKFKCNSSVEDRYKFIQSLKEEPAPKPDEIVKIEENFTFDGTLTNHINEVMFSVVK